MITEDRILVDFGKGNLTTVGPDAHLEKFLEVLDFCYDKQQGNQRQTNQRSVVGIIE
jgi:hypothetical protein